MKRMVLSVFGTGGVRAGVVAAARGINRRNLALAGSAALLAGCQVVPRTETVVTAPPPAPTPEPSATALPSDATRHRVALLVPMGGSAAQVGQSLANATTMALLDTASRDSSTDNLRITTYDTSSGASAAARQAIADGNKLILGPLLADNVAAVEAVAGPANVPAIAFSNDASVASSTTFIMGHTPEQSVARSVQYARKNGSSNFAALFPEGDYGRKAFSALQNSLSDFGGSLVGAESYARGNTSIVSAAQRLRTRGGYDTVLIAEGARLSIMAAPYLRSDGAQGTRLLGTELWSGGSAITRTRDVDGALFSAVSDGRFRRFSDSYEARFGTKPFRIATLGYDAVLLTLRIAQDWRVGDDFPKSRLYDRGGFVGVDGAFRFGRSGVAERALEVRQVRGNQVVAIEAAPGSFSQ
ncbi:penicillin-binding protein activator [Qipengyuania sp. S6317L1]|uniref:penicillin-binding protein activator n=1 Tax=Qipengyuania sp. S6317L1 TaxID=2926410 RepID=UPI001FF64182|nr:penicillin-binding protein activator [Qipengyuania sp. S6317L1]MCK0100635.1 penicillin-binding protein activator [Qipengyuania sp. S6317L1]